MIAVEFRRMGLGGAGACPQEGLISGRDIWQDYGHFTGIFRDFTGMFSSFVRTFHQMGAPRGHCPQHGLKSAP